MINRFMMLTGITSTIYTNFNTSKYYLDIDNYNNLDNYNYDEIYILNFIKKVNLAHRVINDMCETLDDKSSFMYGIEKPNCDYNISFVNGSDIYVYPIKNEIKSFLIDHKKDYCINEKIECGEITIMIKLIDLINSAVRLTKINNNLKNLKLNLNIIDFYTFFNVYHASLNNNEILVNITLEKQRANVILQNEKNRINNELNKATIEKILNSIYNLLGIPIKNTFSFTSNLLSDSFMPSLSLDTKIIIILLLVIFLKIKIV